MANKSILFLLFSLLLAGCSQYENTGFVYPNTITSNDDAYNETFCITYIPWFIPDTLASLTLKIYNSNNHEVYTAESNANLTCWDTVPGSIEPGIYYFIVDYYVLSGPDKKTFWGEFKVVK